MNITKGPIRTALRIGIYGTEGVGKTTFAAQFPGAVFIDTEGSTKHMDVARFDPPESLDDVQKCIAYVIGHPDEFGTLVIDTVDWLERLIFKAVCQENNLKHIEEMGYGKGYVLAKQKMQGLLEMLDDVIRRGIHVVLVCHSMIRKFELPDEMGSYDRYMLKLNEKNIAPLVKEWTDVLLFVNYRTNIVTDEKTKTKKGTGGQKRIMYANHSATWDAKNRFGLPDEMPFEFDRIAHLLNAPKETAAPQEEKIEPMEPVVLPHLNGKAKVTKADKVPPIPADRPESMKSDNPEKDALLAKLWEIMLKDNVPDPLIVQAVVAEKEYYDLTVPIRDYDKDFIEGCLIEAWDAVNKLCQTKINDLPF